MAAHPWIKSYPDGVHWDAEIPVGAGAVDPRRTRSRKYPGHVRASSAWASGSPIASWMGWSDRAAAGLQKLGVGPGVHVGLFLPNTLHYVVGLLRHAEAGGPVVNYSPLDAAKTLEHKIADSETDVMLTLDVPRSAADAAMLGKTNGLKHLVVGGAVSGTTVPFAKLLDNDGKYQKHPVTVDDIAVLQYTGGTTGLPKGAMLTHANLSAACTSVWATLNGNPTVLIEGEERILAVLPLFHIYALTVNMLLGIRLAAETVILHPRFDPEASVKEIAAKKVTSFPGVPTMFTAILRRAGRREVRPHVAQVLRLRRRAAAGRGTAALPEAHRLPAGAKAGA